MKRVPIHSLQAHAMELLQAHGLKRTPARLSILGAFLGQPDHPWAAQEIQTLVPKGVANRVTLYRTLTQFVEAGILKPVNLRHGLATYELASTDHHHIVCERCGLIEEFEGCDPETLVKAALRTSKSFASVRDHAIELFGTCRSCATV